VQPARPRTSAFARVADFLANGILADEAERAIHDDAGIPEALPALIKRNSRRGLERLPASRHRRTRVVQAALKPSELQSEALDVLLTFTHRHASTASTDMPTKPPAMKRPSPVLCSRISMRLMAIQDGELKAKAVELLMQLQLRVEPAAAAADHRR
jgi:hypothetical protein